MTCCPDVEVTSRVIQEIWRKYHTIERMVQHAV